MSSIFRPWSTSGASWRNYRHWYSAPPSWHTTRGHSHTWHPHSPPQYRPTYPRASSHGDAFLQMPRDGGAIHSKSGRALLSGQIFLMEGKRDSVSFLGDLWRLAEGVEAWKRGLGDEEVASSMSSFFFSSMERIIAMIDHVWRKDVWTYVKWLDKVLEKMWNIIYGNLDEKESGRSLTNVERNII